MLTQLAALPTATLECLTDVVRPAELSLQDGSRRHLASAADSAADLAADWDAYSSAESAAESAADPAAVAKRGGGYFKLKRACQLPPADGPEGPSSPARLLVVRITIAASHQRLKTLAGAVSMTPSPQTFLVCLIE